MSAKARKDAGFTMIELLVVIVILAILAAIAIPMFMHQTKKANDAVAKQDVSNMALQILSIVEKQPTMPDLTWVGKTYYLEGEKAGVLSPNTVFVSFTGTDINDWCVDVKNPKGNIAATQGYHYNATGGPETGPC